MRGEADGRLQIGKSGEADTHMLDNICCQAQSYQRIGSSSYIPDCLLISERRLLLGGRGRG